MIEGIQLRGLLLTICLAGMMMPPASAKDVVLEFDALAAAHPSQVEIIFENDYVWVARIKLAPGEGLPTHASGKRFVYPLSGYDVLYIANYEPEQMSKRERQAHFHSAEDHALQNRGKTPAEFVEVILKPAPRPGPRSMAPCEVAKGSPKNANLAFENNDGRVIEIMLEPGEKLASHFSGNRVVYSLSDYQIRMGQSEIRFQKGQAHWHDACEHEVENTGKATARFVVFELKR